MSFTPFIVETFYHSIDLPQIYKDDKDLMQWKIFFIHDKKSLNFFLLLSAFLLKIKKKCAVSPSILLSNGREGDKDKCTQDKIVHKKPRLISSKRQELHERWISKKNFKII